MTSQPLVLNDIGCVADRVLFLDINRVLTSNAFVQFEWMMREINKSAYRALDPLAIDLLNDLEQLSRTQIVLYGSLLQHQMSDAVQYLSHSINCMSNLGFKHSRAIVGFIPCNHELLCAAKIDQYLQEHTDIKHYCILGDGTDVFRKQKAHFVNVSNKTGLARSDILECLNIFNRDIK